jgi:hypothetical protein
MIQHQPSPWRKPVSPPPRTPLKIMKPIGCESADTSSAEKKGKEAPVPHFQRNGKPGDETYRGLTLFSTDDHETDSLPNDTEGDSGASPSRKQSSPLPVVPQEDEYTWLILL